MSTPLKIYIAFMVAVVAYSGFATWKGMTYWEDKAERNIEQTSTYRSHSGYRRNFYHK